jgi:hypothetical protein
MPPAEIQEVLAVLQASTAALPPPLRQFQVGPRLDCHGPLGRRQTLSDFRWVLSVLQWVL